MKKYDAIMIGFGKGAKTLAAEFAKQGKKVAMIEKSSKMYGCLLYTSLPFSLYGKNTVLKFPILFFREDYYMISYRCRKVEMCP